MRKTKFNITFLIFSLFISVQAYAKDFIEKIQYQQRPPIFSTRHIRNENDSKNDASSKKIKIEWEQLSDAERWLVIVAKDEDFENVVFINTVKNNFSFLPYLAPGKYYCKAIGIDKSNAIQESKTQEITIQENPPEILTSPTIITPYEMEYFPPKPRMRIGWKRVKGAKAYRFQIWELDKIESSIDHLKLPQARWITEIKEPWIELYDVPYSTYQYMGNGIYKFDVTPIDSNDELGAMSTSTFKVTPQYYLKPKQLIFGIAPLWAPAWKQKSASALSGESYAHSSSALGLMIDSQWWYRRHFGILGDFSFNTKKLEPIGNAMNYQIGARYAFRTYLSNVESGTGIMTSIGFLFKQFTEVDHASKPALTTAPTGFGPRIGLEVFKRFELGFKFNVGVEAQSFLAIINADGLDYTKKSGINSNSPRISSLIYGKLNFPLTKKSNLQLGAKLIRSKIKYQPAFRLASSAVTTDELFYFAGLEFDY